MTAGWTAKRFWKEAAPAEAEGGGYGIRLDGRPLRTPAKAELILPNLALARAVAEEWQAQGEQIDPRSMPVTRAANAAIDKVTPQRHEVAEMLAAYGDSDLTCYRASYPRRLVERQAEAWDPLLDWAHEAHGARLIPVEGVVHVPQPPEALERLAAPLYAMSPWELTAMHDLVSLTGSLVIALAAEAGWRPAEILWDLSRIDEDWQIEQWGADAEAAADTEEKRRAFLAADRFLRLARDA